MDFLMMVKNILTTFIQDNLYIAIALAALFVFLLFRKPKIFFALVFLALLLTGVLYLISTLSSTGIHQKQKLLQKEEQPYKDHLR